MQMYSFNILLSAYIITNCLLTHVNKHDKEAHNSFHMLNENPPSCGNTKRQNCCCIGAELIKSACVMDLGSSNDVLESVRYVQFLESFALLDSKIGIFAQAQKKAKRYNEIWIFTWLIKY